MGAAFALGADVVELDVHPTTDGRFAVFHDWTLDCRTEGTGETRDHNMAYLKTLDIGYGYTVDGGRTFPLRGTGAGLMPSFSDVMAAFPGKKFLVNFKSNEAREGDTLADMLEANPEWRDSVWAVYGGDKPTNRAIERIAGLGGFSLASLKACLIPYLALGWTGYIPNDCRDTVVIVPINYAAWMWGWPNLFLDRMRSVGSDVMLRGPYTRGQPTGGIDAPADVAQVPAGFDGYVWTNEIAAVAPLLGPQ
jgi:glycerophosphoryl diester phosphodiesterase